MLTYEKADFGKSLDGWYVRVDGKLTGRIVRDDGFLFQPKGHYRQAKFWGDRYETLAACKASLES